MKKNLTRLGSSALAAVLLVTPAFALAKDRDSLRASLGAEVKAEKHACAKAFGHLVAPGWIKANGTSTVAVTCDLPFGIAAKLGFVERSGKATTTDTTGPALRLIRVRTGETSATIMWRTSERATTQVSYGTESSLGSTTALKSDLKRDHQVKITGLMPGTTYHFKVMSKDANGNLTTSTLATFTTKTDDDRPTLSISSVAATNITSSGATIRWTTNVPAPSKVYFTSANTLDRNTAAQVVNPSLTTNHSVSLAGLAASTTYRYAVQAKGELSPVGIFTTTP